MIVTSHLPAYHDIEYTQLRLPHGGLTRHSLIDAVPRGRLLVLVMLNNVVERELAKFNHYNARPLQPDTLAAYPLQDAEGRQCQVIALDHRLNLVPNDTVIIGSIPDPNLEEL